MWRTNMLESLMADGVLCLVLWEPTVAKRPRVVGDPKRIGHADGNKEGHLRKLAYPETGRKGRRKNNHQQKMYRDNYTRLVCDY